MREQHRIIPAIMRNMAQKPCNACHHISTGRSRSPQFGDNIGDKSRTFGFLMGKAKIICQIDLNFYSNDLYSKCGSNYNISRLEQRSCIKGRSRSSTPRLQRIEDLRPNQGRQTANNQAFRRQESRNPGPHRLSKAFPRGRGMPGTRTHFGRACRGSSSLQQGVVLNDNSYRFSKQRG